MEMKEVQPASSLCDREGGRCRGYPSVGDIARTICPVVNEQPTKIRPTSSWTPT
jgi:hypothetical protein